MSAGAEVVVHRDAELLAHAVAARLATRLVDAQAARGSASVVLTGGGVGIAMLRALRDSPLVDTVDWSRLDVYWGDERFVPADDPERNEGQAREALLDHVPIHPERVFAMPASDGPDGDDVDAAAARYGDVLARRAVDSGDARHAVPQFDVLLLGMGGEGHTASIFPESPAVYDTRPVTAVRGCPKPPPTRISLTFPSIATAREVWVVTAGAEKAPAVRLALSGAGPAQIPAAGAHGQARTLFLLDEKAANKLPPLLRVRH